MTKPRAPGHYWIILEEGAEPEIAHFDGDDWFAVGNPDAVAPTAIFSERIEPPATRPDARPAVPS